MIRCRVSGASIPIVPPAKASEPRRGVMWFRLGQQPIHVGPLEKPALARLGLIQHVAHQIQIGTLQIFQRRHGK